ncbi:MAG TPA: hypothetical protein VMU50_02705 [Polyangia bacterium]|nr:hypothetical protein [Polyangia bacterium]
MTRSSRVAFPLTSILIVVAATGCEALEDYAKTHPGELGSGAAPPPPAKACASTASCGDGLVCTVDEGVCNPPPGCGPKMGCLAVCYGTCEPKKAPPPKGEACGPKICDAGLTCCNPSCGICAPPGGACTKQLCPPSPPAAECKADADCRAFSNYCDGCACDALAVGEKDPVCNGMAVQCFADPCLNKTAACSAGQCVLASPTPPKCDQRTQGGPTSCKPADLWKQYASDDCKASGLVLSEISPREDCGGGFTRFVDYTCCTP